MPCASRNACWSPSSRPPRRDRRHRPTTPRNGTRAAPGNAAGSHPDDGPDARGRRAGSRSRSLRPAAFRRALAHAPAARALPSPPPRPRPSTPCSILGNGGIGGTAGAERRVALGDLVEVVLVDHLPQEQGHLRDRGHVRATLRLVAVQQVLGGAPAQDRSSFHARLMPSRMPEQAPCPMYGIMVCAASPARNTRPSRQRSAMRVSKCDHVAQQLQVVRPQAIAFMQPAPAGVLLFPIGRFLAGQHTQLETVRRVPIGMCM